MPVGVERELSDLPNDLETATRRNFREQRFTCTHQKQNGEIEHALVSVRFIFTAMVAVTAGAAQAREARPGSWLLDLPYPLRNALRRWRGLVGMIVGVGFALSIGMTILAVISAEMDLLTGDFQHSNIGVYVTTEGGKLVAVVAGDSPGTIQNGSTLLTEVRSWPGVQNALGTLTWPLTHEPEGPRRRGQPTEVQTVVGVEGDPSLVPGMLTLDDGRWLRNANDIVIGKTLAKNKDLKVGDVMRLNGATSTIVGIGKLHGFTTFGQEGVVYMDYKTLIQRAQLAGVFNVIAIQTTRPDAVSARLADVGGLSSWTPAQLVAESQKSFASSIAIDWILILMTLGIAALFVATMLNHSVSERRAEFAVLRAIGLPAWWVILTVALESLAITVAAGILGVLISFGLGWLLNATLTEQYGVDSFYRADPQLFLIIFLLATGLGAISGILPARKAATVDPVEVLREV